MTNGIHLRRFEGLNIFPRCRLPQETRIVANKFVLRRKVIGRLLAFEVDVKTKDAALDESGFAADIARQKEMLALSVVSGFERRLNKSSVFFFDLDITLNFFD